LKIGFYCDKLQLMILKEASVHIGELPEGITVDGLVAVINRSRETLGVTPSNCEHALPDGYGCKLNRDRRIRKVGKPLGCILCGDQTIINFKTEISDKEESLLLQCVFSPWLLRL
jgi:hypothetical protein